MIYNNKLLSYVYQMNEFSIENLKDPKAFTKYSKNVQDVYKNIGENVMYWKCMKKEAENVMH